MIEKYKRLFALATGHNPTKVGVYNGVAVRDVPWYSQNDFAPMQKHHLWNATKKYLSADDDVLVVGAGKGVVPVKASAYGANVVVIEAAIEMVEQMRKTATLNQQQIEVIHGLVEAGHDIFGDGSSADHLTTDDLSGDMLVLDCEGAEQDILPAPQFETVVVETHPMFGANTPEIIELLDGEVEYHAKARHDGAFLIRQ